MNSVTKAIENDLLTATEKPHYWITFSEQVSNRSIRVLTPGPLMITRPEVAS